MTASEFATSSALQIFLECPRFGLGFERNSGFNSPWPMFGSVRTGALVVFKKAFFKVTRHTSIVNSLVCATNEDINVEKGFRVLACQAVVFGALGEKIKHSPPPLRYGVAAFVFSLRSKAKAGPARIRTWDQGIMSPLL
jgi:hypothetical protein